jgi:hypothetical protein
MIDDKLLAHKNVNGAIVFALAPHAFNLSPILLILWLQCVVATYKARNVSMHFGDELQKFYDQHVEDAERARLEISKPARTLLDFVLEHRAWPSNSKMIDTLQILQAVLQRAPQITNVDGRHLSIKYSLKNHRNRLVRLMTLKSNPIAEFGDEAGPVALNALTNALEKEEGKPVSIWNSLDFSFSTTSISNTLSYEDSLAYRSFVAIAITQSLAWVKANYGTIKSVCDFYETLSKTTANHSDAR